ncbi:MAG: dephospho-CoA kinase, partial [Trueperaceae bacterium]|nr:dephospho-CoA kinase [Trueperaceae bacterium]
MSASTADGEGRARRSTAPGYPPRIGLTGSVGAGKSSVARRLAERGALVIDADALARRATEDPGVLARIAAEVAPGLVVDGRLDRAATARRVFGDPDARRRLEAIVHPWVRRAAAAAEAAAMAAATPPPLIVHDVPLLFETGLDAGMDATVVVDAPFAVRAARLAVRSGMDEAAVRARDAAQLGPAEKAARASFVIDNGGDEGALDDAV